MSYPCDTGMCDLARCTDKLCDAPSINNRIVMQAADDIALPQNSNAKTSPYAESIL